MEPCGAHQNAIHTGGVDGGFADAMDSCRLEDDALGTHAVNGRGFPRLPGRRANDNLTLDCRVDGGRPNLFMTGNGAITSAAIKGMRAAGDHNDTGASHGGCRKRTQAYKTTLLQQAGAARPRCI